MKWYPAFNQAPRCCDADKVWVSSVTEEIRMIDGKWRRVRSQRVLHHKGEMRFWHWKDQTVIVPGTYSEETGEKIFDSESG